MQTSLEVKLPKETADLPVLFDGEEHEVRCAIHENHAEEERADMLFVELYSKARVVGDYAGKSAAGSPVRIVHMRWPMLLVHALVRLEESGTLQYAGPPVIVDRREYTVAGIELRKSPNGARANAVVVVLSHDAGLVAHQRTIGFPVRLLRILLKEAETIA